jgi:hypothetical protein
VKNDGTKRQQLVSSAHAVIRVIVIKIITLSST